MHSLESDELTIAEASEILGVSYTAVLNMIADGRIRVVREAMHKSRRRVWVSRETVEEEKVRRTGKPTDSE